ATTSTSSRASSSRLPPAPMALGTSTRFLLVATRAPDRRLQIALRIRVLQVGPQPQDRQDTGPDRAADASRPRRRDHRTRNLLQCKCPLALRDNWRQRSTSVAFGAKRTLS